MNVYGLDALKSVQSAVDFQLKAILNDSDDLSVAFFSAHSQHREMKIGGLSYEDDYRGNALAAMVSRGKLEIRFHKAFPDSRVRELIQRIKSHPDLESLRDYAVTYQGRALE